MPEQIDPKLTTETRSGAGNSKGRTSWTAKPETDDYISFIGLMVYFMHYLSVPPAFCASADIFLDDTKGHDLTPIPSHALPPPHSPTSPRSHWHSSNTHAISPSNTGFSFEDDIKNASSFTDLRPLLVLAGYSYGSMIAAQLPGLSSILALFSTPEVGTAAWEIRCRAKQLAKQENDILISLASPIQEKAANHVKSRHRRGRSLQTGDILEVRKSSAASSIRMGGEETDPGVRRPSHDSHARRSFSFEPARLRKSVDRVRSLGRRPNCHNSVTSPRRQDSIPSRHDSSGSGSADSLEIISHEKSGQSSGQSDGSKVDTVELEDIKVSYILVSPLQGMVTKLATMWSFGSKSKTAESAMNQGPAGCEMENKLILNDTLAIFGDEDVFSSSKKLRAWASRLAGAANSRFQQVEVAGTGHFWHEAGGIEQMNGAIREFLPGL